VVVVTERLVDQVEVEAVEAELAQRRLKSPLGVVSRDLVDAEAEDRISMPFLKVTAGTCDMGSLL
jgi:hypothetical protein